MIFDIVEEEIFKDAELIHEQQIREEQMHNSFLELIERKAILTAATTLLKVEDNEEDEEK